ncbi:MAG: phosphotransferase enzyme family protein [Aristaeellaceae bacterium]
MPAYSPEKAAKILTSFDLYGQVVSVEPYGCGHINDTFRVITRKPGTDKEHRYILQRLSPVAFHEPEKVMENIGAVTAYLKKIIQQRGGDPDRETLIIIPARDGREYILDHEQGGCWRMYLFIENSYTCQQAESEDVFREAARAFGAFQRDLTDYPAQTLHETIPYFHHTPRRVQALETAVEKDAVGRVADAQEEIAFALARKERARTLTDALQRGELPLRVTHNDTKLNNVLMDSVSGKAMCVVDLDTVMPGLCAYDFGDAIRFGANTALEDEADLSKVHFSMPMFRAYSEGYLEQAGDLLTQAEVRSLPMGAWTMTYEVGIRFLTDYLDGDHYFHTTYPEHNLVRARNQFALLADMERQEQAMQAIMEDYLKGKSHHKEEQ